jgi:uncharacterized membrane protein YiaA
MSIFESLGGLISGIFKPATDLASELILDKDKLVEFKTKLSDIEHRTAALLIQAESKAIEAASKQALAESSSDNTFTKMYRPLIITGMFLLICLDCFGLLNVKLPEIFLTIFGTTFGVTSISRGIEKVTKIRNLGE